MRHLILNLRWIAVSILPFLLVCTCTAQQSVIQERSHTTENLRSVSSPSPGVVWASGTHGTYLRSLDNGNSWQVAQVPGAEELDFRDLQAFSADVAYLLSIGPAEQSRIYKTSDGGKNWSLQFTNKEPKGFFDCMAFWDQDRGIAVGDPVNGKFALIATADAGKTWASLPLDRLPPAIDGEGAFAASGTCIMTEGKNNVWFATGGNAARVFRSRNRGRTWTVADTPMIHGSDSMGIFSISFRDAKHGVIAGGDYKDPEKAGAELAFSDDGGASWKLAPVTPQWFLSVVAFDPRNKENIWVAGTAGAAYSEDVQAKTWMKKWPVNVNAFAFSPGGDAFAVGPNGTIVHFIRPTLGAK
jgi:photosystem II stability/assembly factor-like uncharacterized protein